MIANSQCLFISRKLALVFILRYRSWYDVFSPRFILRNLKGNCTVCLVYIKFNFANILDILTMIFNCINKQKKMSSKQSLVRKIYLLRFLSLNLSEMLSYNYYVRLGFSLYEVSSLDSFRCVEYIRKNCSSCNVLSISFK